MHNAPSVTYPVGRSLFQARLQAGLWLLGALVVAAWTWQTPVFGWRQGLALAAVGVTGAIALVGWWRMPTGALRWDGQQWFWAGPGEPVPVTIRVPLDLQWHLLLCLQTEQGARLWCWAERARQPQRWRDLRRAVYSPARPPSRRDPAPVSEP